MLATHSLNGRNGSLHNAAVTLTNRRSLALTFAGNTGNLLAVTLPALHTANKPIQVPLNGRIGLADALLQQGWNSHSDWTFRFREAPGSFLLDMGLALEDRQGEKIAVTVLAQVRSDNSLASIDYMVSASVALDDALNHEFHLDDPDYAICAGEQGSALIVNSDHKRIASLQASGQQFIEDPGHHSWGLRELSPRTGISVQRSQYWYRHERIELLTCCQPLIS